MTVVMYGTAIQEAIARGDLERMKALRNEAREHLREYGNISIALELLEIEIKKLELSAQKGA